MVSLRTVTKLSCTFSLNIFSWRNPVSDNLTEQALRIRMIEQAIAARYPEGKMRCPVHLSIGQEAGPVGVCAALPKDAKMVGSHRSHAWYLAKGGSVKGLLAELYGRRTGCSRGMGGSMHLLSLADNFYGSTSIVGGTIPYGVGLSWASHLRGGTEPTVITFGDAAVEEGVFHEAANFASLHGLRVLFVCENNEFSCFTHISRRRLKSGYSHRFDKIAAAHNLFYKCASTNATIQQYARLTNICLKELPAFLEIPTWRHLEHCGPNNDDHLGYRDVLPLEPLPIPPDFIASVEQEIQEAFKFAEESPLAEEVNPYAD